VQATHKGIIIIITKATMRRRLDLTMEVVTTNMAEIIIMEGVTKIGIIKTTTSKITITKTMVTRTSSKITTMTLKIMLGKSNFIIFMTNPCFRSNYNNTP
jgi:hypothetical protein